MCYLGASVSTAAEIEAAIENLGDTMDKVFRRTGFS